MEMRGTKPKYGCSFSLRPSKYKKFVVGYCFGFLVVFWLKFESGNALPCFAAKAEGCVCVCNRCSALGTRVFHRTENWGASAGMVVGEGAPMLADPCPFCSAWLQPVLCCCFWGWWGGAVHICTPNAMGQSLVLELQD